MNDKQILQMLEVLGRNGRKSKSLAASEVVTKDNRDREGDTRCAKTLRNIILNQNSGSTKSLQASKLTNPSPNRDVNRVRVLTDFIFRNGLR